MYNEMAGLKNEQNSFFGPTTFHQGLQLFEVVGPDCGPLKVGVYGLYTSEINVGYIWVIA